MKTKYGKDAMTYDDYKNGCTCVPLDTFRTSNGEDMYWQLVKCDIHNDKGVSSEKPRRDG